MSLKPQTTFEIPELTVKIARAAFPKGNVYMTMRDEFGVLYDDQQFAHLFSHTGQPGETPWRLALATVMQFAESLTDRQAADAVRARIDWKYALGLEMEDPGFHYSVLSEFRTRLLDGGAEQLLLDSMLDRFKTRKLLKARGKQRTDSTHILAAVRTLNRLELVGETLHHALNILAEVTPDWLQAQITAEWFERYGQRFDNTRLPKEQTKREELALTIGRDGRHLLAQIYAATDLVHLRSLPAVETLRGVWVQQYYMKGEALYWRTQKQFNLPPAGLTIASPYDVEVRYSNKRGLTWHGYKVHLTETCDDQTPHLVTHVETTPVDVLDNQAVEAIHSGLKRKELLPNRHVTDSGYMDGELLVSSQADYGVKLYGPVRPDNSWQSREASGFDVAQFKIDWDNQVAACPQGTTSYKAKAGKDASGRDIFRFVFREQDCGACAVREQCTRGKARFLTILPKKQHEALQTARQRQETAEFRDQYAVRAGIEGTISQAVNALEMRRTRYRGLAKTHLQHVASAAAMNLIRVVNWLLEIPRSVTRTSRFAMLAPA
jgi:transposase